MKTTRPLRTYLFTTVLALTGTALAVATENSEEKSKQPEKITLEDVVFDKTYLQQLLGPKTLVTAVVETTRNRKKSATALADAVKAVREQKLDEKSQIFALPDDATEPKLLLAAPHVYPPGLKFTHKARKAEFLILIGADGAVKCLYCYSNNDKLFALAAAKAVSKWRYEPVRINGTAVPVLAGLPIRYEIAEGRTEDYSRRGLERILPAPVEYTP